MCDPHYNNLPPDQQAFEDMLTQADSYWGCAGCGEGPLFCLCPARPCGHGAEDGCTQSLCWKRGVIVVCAVKKRKRRTLREAVMVSNARKASAEGKKKIRKS